MSKEPTYINPLGIDISQPYQFIDKGWCPTATYIVDPFQYSQLVRSLDDGSLLNTRNGHYYRVPNTPNVLWVNPKDPYAFQSEEEAREYMALMLEGDLKMGSPSDRIKEIGLDNFLAERDAFEQPFRDFLKANKAYLEEKYGTKTEPLTWLDDDDDEE